MYEHTFSIAFPSSSWLDPTATLAPLLAAYPFDPTCPFGGGYCALTDALGDQWVYCANKVAMEGLLTQNPQLQIYGYIDNYASAVEDVYAQAQGILGNCQSKYGVVCHSAEIYLLFNLTIAQPYLSPIDKFISSVMINSWANFAYSGNPNHGVRPLRGPNGNPLFSRFNSSLYLTAIEYPLTGATSYKNFHKQQCDLFSTTYGYNQYY